MREFLKEWFAFSVLAVLLTGWGPLQVWRVPVGPLNRAPIQLYPDQPDMGQAELLSKASAVYTPGILKLEMAQIYERGRLFKQAKRLYEEVTQESHHPAEVAVARESLERLIHGGSYPRREIYPTFQAVERNTKTPWSETPPGSSAVVLPPNPNRPEYSSAPQPTPTVFPEADHRLAPRSISEPSVSTEPSAPVLPAAPIVTEPVPSQPAATPMLSLLESLSTLSFQTLADRTKELLNYLGLPELTRVYTETEIQNFAGRQIETRLLKQVTDVQVKLHPGFIVCSGTAHLGPLEIQLSSEIGMSIEDGKLRVQMKGLKIGSAALPESVCRLLESRANESLQKDMGSLEFKRFELNEGYLIATLSDSSVGTSSTGSDDFSTLLGN